MTREQMIRRFNLVSAYQNNQTDAEWEALRRAIIHESGPLGVECEGGLVTDIVSEDAALVGLAVVVIDYDIEGADEEDLTVVKYKPSATDEIEGVRTEKVVAEQLVVERSAIEIPVL